MHTRMLLLLLEVLSSESQARSWVLPVQGLAGLPQTQHIEGAAATQQFQQHVVWKIWQITLLAANIPLV